MKARASHRAQLGDPAPQAGGKALRARAEACLGHLSLPDILQRHRSRSTEVLGQRKFAIRQHGGENPLDLHAALLQFEGVAGWIDQAAQVCARPRFAESHRELLRGRQRAGPEGSADGQPRQKVTASRPSHGNTHAASVSAGIEPPWPGPVPDRIATTCIRSRALLRPQRLHSLLEG